MVPPTTAQAQPAPQQVNAPDLDTVLGRFTPQDLRTIVDGFRNRVASQGDNPVTHSTNIQTLARNILALEALRNLLRNPPQEYAPNRRLYTDAIAVLGGGDETRAMTAVMDGQIVALREMRATGPINAQTVGEYTAPLLLWIDRFQSTSLTLYSLQTTDPRASEAPADLTNIGAQLSGRAVGAATQQRAAEHLEFTSLPPLPQLSIVPLATGSRDMLYTLGQPTTLTRTYFGANTDAFVRGYSGALSLAFGPESPYSSQEVQTALTTSLNDPTLIARLTNPDGTVNPNLLAAQAAAARGDFRGAVIALNNLRSLSGVLNELRDNLFAVHISQQGAILYSFGLNTQFQINSAERSIREWLGGGASGFRIWPLTQLTLGVRATWFNFTGDYERMAADFSGGNLNFRRTGERGALTNSTGYAHTANLALTGTVGMFNRPFDVTAHIEVGIRDFESTTTVTGPSGPRTLRVTEADTRTEGDISTGAGTLYVGLWGLTMSPRQDLNAPVRWYTPALTSLTAAGYGDRGILGSVTMDWLRYRSAGNRVTLDTYLTAQASYIGARIREGSIQSINDMIRPENIAQVGISAYEQITYAPSSRVRIFGGPTIRYDVDVVTGDASRLAVGGMAGVDLPRAGLRFDATVTHSMPFGDLTRMPPPTTAVVGNLTVTPQRWFEPSRTAVVGTRITSPGQLPDPVRRNYLGAVDHLRQFPDDTQSEQALRFASALATLFSSPLGGLQGTDLVDNPDLIAAINSFRQHNLVEGLRLLRRIPVFQALEREGSR